MKLRLLAFCLAAGSTALLAQDRAKNVILFLGDAGGLSTLSAASIHGYKAPQKLFVQHMPHIAFSDTSSSSSWVTDSAAGMTALVTGQKTSNGTLSQTPTGEPLKTILEYAEERGLSTGVISNVNMADATPAACYSHVDSRKKFSDIFSQVWNPKFGDGVDLILGTGRTRIADSLREMNVDLDQQLRASGREVYATLGEVPANAKRPVVLTDEKDFKVDEATALAIKVLSHNPKGYFLMVEWDLHPTHPQATLERVVALDRLVEQTVTSLASKDTLVIFTADHSFDFRLRAGKRDQPLNLPADAKESAAGKFDAAVGTGHTGEEVVMAAHGPGSKAIQGFLPNTALFQIMLDAYGWKAVKKGT